MRHRAEALTHLAGDALGWRVRRHQVWIVGFQCLELAHQRVIRRITDGRPVEYQ